MRRALRRRAAAGACALAAALGGASAAAQPSSGIELRLDNDQFAFTPGERERWYSHGAFLAAAFEPAPGHWDAAALHALCAALLDCATDARVLRVLSLGHTIHTPSSTRIAEPQPDDRPYAATLYAGLAAVSHGPAVRHTLAVRAGVIGPAARGEPVQNAIHRLIGEPPAQGWGAQVPAQPLLELAWSRLARVGLPWPQSDAVLRTSIQLGTPLTQASVGAALRYGPGAIDPAWPGETGLAERPRGWRVLAGVELRAVAHDALLEARGLPYASSVSRAPWVGEAFAGLGWPLGERWVLDATVVWRTIDFESAARDALPGSQRFGMLSLRWGPVR